VSTITIYFSTDKINWTPVAVPAGNITGAGTPNGTYYVYTTLASGTWFYYAKLKTQNGDTAYSSQKALLVP
jgi:hypothetical protein